MVPRLSQLREKRAFKGRVNVLVTGPGSSAPIAFLAGRTAGRVLVGHLRRWRIRKRQSPSKVRFQAVLPVSPLRACRNARLSCPGSGQVNSGKNKIDVGPAMHSERDTVGRRAVNAIRVELSAMHTFKSQRSRGGNGMTH